MRGVSRREEVRLRALQRREDRPALGQEPRRGLAVGQREDGEAGPRAEPVEAAEVVVGEEAAQRQETANASAQPAPARRQTSQVSSPQQSGKATTLESRRIVA